MRRSESEIAAWLASQIASILNVPVQTIDVKATFHRFGLSSTDAVGISGSLEEWLERRLSPTLLYDYPTIEALARHLAEGPAVMPREDRAERNTVEAEPVAIIGIGCRFPQADGPEAYWDLLREGRDAISEVPPDRWNKDALYDPDPAAPGKMNVKWGGFLDHIADFDAHAFGISPHEALRMDPQQRILLEMVWAALEDAGVNPEQLAGSRSGVFIANSGNEYARSQYSKPHLLDGYTGTGNAASILANRISFFYDLRGPSLTVDTACSSSLTAVHLACRSIRSGESSLAIVGAVNLILHPTVTIAFAKAGALAKDGRCKTFDSRADGYIRSEGAGVVVLKPLRQALADKDLIYAVICGSALTQDGRTNGLTAPSRQAQAQVLREAYQDADLSPGIVQYVETHGSGTALGDPIEVAALADVIAKNREPWNICSIGSVKTNLGHLEAAAGMAGLIKVAMALHHEELPPSLHFRTPNPHIPFDSLPIRVQQTRSPWPRGAIRRVAGVSSFGFGGTNAHVVLEEPPAISSAAPGLVRQWQLLSLSAKTETALDRGTENLAEFLKQNPTVSLHDVAYTLHVGREPHRFRRVTVCRDSAEARRVLAPLDFERVWQGHAETGDLKVAFMFPGLGDHYVHMARDLYEQEPDFRRSLDQCFALITAYSGSNPRLLLYPPGRPDPNGEYPSSTSDISSLLRTDSLGSDGTRTPLDQTSVIQPVLFSVEYSIAKLLMSWGVQPSAVIGYSLGEYVAACISGVLSLEDALYLVVRRAQLIQTLPPGAMLAVPLSEMEVQAFLNPEISVAVISAPNVCVLAGSLAGIQESEVRLKEKNILFRRVQTNHAFHSAMMDPIIETFADLAKSVKLNQPQIRCLSNVTGAWVNDEMSDPAYWARHLRCKVKFEQGIRHLLKEPNTVLLEVGPGQSLSSSVKQQCSPDQIRKILACLPSAQQRQPDLACLLFTVGKLWTLGVRIYWNAFYAGGPGQKLRLPNYSFERKRYWFPQGGEESQGHAETRPAESFEELRKTQDIAGWFYLPIWKQSRPVMAPRRKHEGDGQPSWLLLGAESSFARQLCRRMQDHGCDVIQVADAKNYSKKNSHLYYLDPRDRSHFERLLDDLAGEGHQVSRIAHLWNMSRAKEGEDRVRECLDSGFFALTALSQALGNRSAQEAATIIVIASGVHRVIGDEPIFPERATLMGPCSVIPREYTNISCRIVDIPLSDAGTEQESRAVEYVIAEMNGSADPVVAYRGTRRWVPDFERVRLEPIKNRPEIRRTNGAYLITGGLGGIGLAIAGHLAGIPGVRLALLGRSALPPRSQWDALLADPAAGLVQERIRQIQALEKTGAEVTLYAADVSDRKQMQAVVRDVMERFGGLNGVIHAAGVPGGGLAQFMTREAALEVFRPKIEGTLILEEVLRDIPIDFLALMSSVTAIVGGTAGQMDYCAANSFLDSFAQAHSTRDRLTISINWGEWQWNSWEGRLAGLGPRLADLLRANRQRIGMSFGEGVEAFDRVLEAGFSNVVVSPVELRDLIHCNRALSVEGMLATTQKLAGPQATYPRPVLGTPFVAPRTKTEMTIASIWQDLLCVDQIGLNDNFFELGGSSLLGIRLIGELRKKLNVEIAMHVLYEAPTVSSMARRLAAPGSEMPALSERQARGEMRRKLSHRGKQGVS